MIMEVSAALTEGRAITPRVGDEGVTSLLVTHFEDLVQATGSAKLLKQLVLHLAMQGRLSDGPTESVESLRVEVRHARDRLAKSGVRVRDLLPVEDSDVPWSLPTGWAWVRLGELGGFLGGGTPSKSNGSFWAGPLPWVSPKDMKQPYIDDAEDHISMAAVEESAAKLIPKGSVLCVVRGMILAHSFPVALTRREVAINQDMKALVLALPAVGEFVLRACQDARARVLASVERSSHGTCRLDGEVVENLLIPLPPLAEQKRIVAKVDQLMALCDDLEARQTKKRDTSTRLTKSALQALTTAEGPEEFDLAWKRVVENFDVLIDRSEKVQELRMAVVDLAIAGRLVGTAPGDSARLTVAEMEKASGHPREILEAPGPLPVEWEWSRLGSVSSEVRYGYTASANDDRAGVRMLRITDIQNERVDWPTVPGCEIDEDKVAAFELHDGDLVIARTGGTIGKTYLVRGLTVRSVFASYLIRVSPLPGVNPAYLKVFTSSGLYWRQLHAGSAGTGQPNVNATTLKDLLIPVPPMQEQVRIVARVEQLMKVCDELEARLTRAEERASQLVEAVVQELVA